MADPPHGKATILHCGCVLDAADQVGMAYVQVSVSSKAKGHLMHIGGSLYSDAMGDEGTAEGTYIGMVRANVRTIVSALK